MLQLCPGMLGKCQGMAGCTEGGAADRMYAWHRDLAQGTKHAALEQFLRKQQGNLAEHVKPNPSRVGSHGRCAMHICRHVWLIATTF